MTTRGRAGRMALLVFGGLSLLTGLWSGMVRLGWVMPIPNEQLVIAHGPLMVIGFIGTLIGLERAVALGRWWPYAIPALTALSAASFIGGFDGSVAASFAAAASLVLIAVFAALYRQYPSEHFIVMALSALAWLAGNLLWATAPPRFAVVPWWVGFLVLMIAGERLELSRIRRPPIFVRVVFHASVAIVSAGLAWSLVDFPFGVRISGAGLFAVALWLLRYDLSWHSARQRGLPRYMALCLIAGYFWLAAGGLLWLGNAEYFSAGPRYDAMLHAIFLGFVFSMIFAHAPIIFPTITGMALPYRNIFYLHAALLHLSVLLRVAGDFSLLLPLQRWGGLLNGLAILLFLANNVRAVRAGRGGRLSREGLVKSP
jgi:hypothetical protein